MKRIWQCECGRKTTFGAFGPGARAEIEAQMHRAITKGWHLQEIPGTTYLVAECPDYPRTEHVNRGRGRLLRKALARNFVTLSA